MREYILSILVLIAAKGFAQKDTTPALTFSGYVETYYAYDFNKPANHNRAAFSYAYTRHNEVNLNLGYIKAAYQKENVRANLAIMAGTYSNANLAAEPGALKNIFEANAGFKIAKKKNLWIDAGIFASHIGFESAIGKDCWNLTRSILADNSPYFETGAKISYTSDDGKLFLSGLLLNGWQRIQRIDGNNTPAFGHQLVYKPNSKVTLNSSSFIGNDKPDSARRMRYFHNFYGIFQLTDKLALTTGFDIGTEQKEKGSHDYYTWYSPVVILKLSPSSKNNFAARIEYFSDADGVIVSTSLPYGFKTWGYSVNYDYLIHENILWRMEARRFSSKDKIFEKEGKLTNSNFIFVTSLAINF